jgi:transcriptional regulator with XRE-family HTH domain
VSKAQEIGRRIAQARREKAAREERDIRPADVARELKVSGATVSDWESGKITPRDDALERLGAFLGVTPAYLRYGVTATPSRAEQHAAATGATFDEGKGATPAEWTKQHEAKKKVAKKGDRKRA